MNDICAIIVSHNPDERLTSNIDKIIKQDVSVVIVDNASSGQNFKLISHYEKSKDVFIIKNKTNIGLAAALNQGVRFAIGNNYKWVATFDQDSVVTNLFFKLLLEAIDACKDKHKVALIAPKYQDQTTGKIQSFKDDNSIDENSLSSYITTTNTSGNLIKIDVFDKIGLFRDDFFIDYIDIEFCLRCRQNGYRIIESKQALLLHNVGIPRQHKLMWKTPLSSNHQPVRRYYITRNRLIVYKSYFARYPKWVVSDLYLMLKDIIKILVYEDNAFCKYHWMLRGVQDAVLKRMGPILYTGNTE